MKTVRRDRMRRHPAVIAAACIVLLASCVDPFNITDYAISAEARTALENARGIEILSLRPGQEANTPVDEAETFHGWQVLGRTKITNEPDRTRIVDALLRGADESYGTVASCFEPRHGVRAQHDDKIVDFVICFECRQVYVYIDGNDAGWFATMPSPQPTFDQILRDARIELAPSAFIIEAAEAE